MEITAAEQNIEKRMKRNEDSLRDLWDNTKPTNIRILGVPEGEEREKGPEKIFEEIISELSLGFPGGSEVKESACNVGNLGSIPGSRRSPGEGNSNPLQYSCLENPMDGGAWRFHRVAKSWTRLSNFTPTFILSERSFM